jgi:hypothetical protein
VRRRIAPICSGAQRNRSLAATETVSLLRPMQVSGSRADRQRQLEASARAAFEACADRKLTDAEWTAMRTRFMEFGKILRLGPNHSRSWTR